jgi:hypothetical protein
MNTPQATDPEFTAAANVYNVLECVGDDWYEYGLMEKPPADAFEYSAALLDADGNEVGAWDSMDEGLAMHPKQYLSRQQAQRTCDEILADVAAGNIEAWFTQTRRAV